ncbi:DUF4058 family protein [Romeria aff. gracilis LEGE 07310]|uniref:DUF4058 family protein n=1 Tax=Vasconcelosia minhoensis LEGE 07310 TaxID=915328 RepID=A0A8J7A9B6_9CYAN|nr:DUF4058 family protein [Romeria aff. gracilis LEGE 07310]
MGAKNLLRRRFADGLSVSWNESLFGNPHDLAKSPPIPTFWVPLKPEDNAIAINLKPLLDEIYELSGYDLDINYNQDPVPVWPVSELEWIDRQLKSQELR